MTQVSRHFLSKRVYERVFEVFLRSVIKIRDKKEAQDFFDDFLTPTERIMLAKRLSIAFLIFKGYDYRTIRQVLHVSTATVGSVNKILRYGGEGYKRVIGKVLSEEKTKEMLLELLGNFADLGSLAGSPAWRGVQKGLKERQKSPF